MSTQNSQITQTQYRRNLYSEFNKVANNNFEQQLNERLNFIAEKESSMRKLKQPEEGSSKKLSNNNYGSKHSKKRIQYESSEDLSSQSSNPNYSRQRNIIDGKKEPLANLMDKKRFTVQRELSQGQIAPQYTHILSDQSIISFLKKYFGNSSNEIKLYQFIQAALIEYSQLENMKEKQIQDLAEIAMIDLTTTDPQYLSFNALQILTKKINLKSYIVEKIPQIKYRRKKKQLQITYKELLEDFNQKQQEIGLLKKNLQKKDHQLHRRENDIYAKEKSLKEKESILAKKQRDLIERDKHLKILLKDKAQKLLNQQTKQLEKILSTITTKSVNFEKNARMKLQAVQRRIDEMNQLRALENSLNREKKVQYTQQQDYTYRIKKLQREIQKNKDTYSQNTKKIQEENKAFLKASTVLESKLQKVSKKLKKKEEQVQHKNQQLSRISSQIKQKDEMIHQLILTLKERDSQLWDSRKRSQPSSSAMQQNEEINRIQQKKNSILKNKKQSIKKSRCRSTNNLHQKKKSTNLTSVVTNCQLIIDYYETLLQKVVKSQQQQVYGVLIEQAETIIQKSIPIVCILMNEKLVTTFIPEFIFKLVTMTCSLYKFREVNTLLTETQHSKIDQFLKNIRQTNSSLLIGKYLNNQVTLVQEYLYRLQNIRFQQQAARPLTAFSYMCLYLSLFEDRKKKGGSLSLNTLLRKSTNQSQLIWNEQSADQLVTYLLHRYIQPLTVDKGWESNSLLVIDLFLELCGNQKFLSSLFSLHNYRILILAALNLMKTGPQKNRQNSRQISQKVTIILQRLVYRYNGQIQVKKKQLKTIKEMTEKLEKLNAEDDQLLIGNLKSILNGVTDQ